VKNCHGKNGEKKGVGGKAVTPRERKNAGARAHHPGMGGRNFGLEGKFPLGGKKKRGKQRKHLQGVFKSQKGAAGKSASRI